MAYSENTRLLVIELVKQGRSAEAVVEYLSRLLHDTGQTGYDTVSEIARSLSINFTRADWDELKYGIPDPKTIQNGLNKKPPMVKIPENKNL